MKSQPKDTEIIVPELEEAMKHYRPISVWTEQSIAQMKRYYGKVPITLLARTVGHSRESTQKKAEQLGLTRGKKDAST